MAKEESAVVRIVPLLGTPPESRQQTGGKLAANWQLS